MNFNIAENIPLFMQSLEVIGPGYLGIFIVILALVGVVNLLNKFTSGK